MIMYNIQKNNMTNFMIKLIMIKYKDKNQKKLKINKNKIHNIIFM